MMAMAFSARARLLHRIRCNAPSRRFTISAPALKKRGGTSSIDADDLFSSSAEDDLFPSSLESSKTASSTSPRTTTAFQKPFVRKKSKKRNVPVQSALEQFDEHYAFLMDRIGPKPVARHPQVRTSGVRRLLYHSRVPEHLDRIMEVLVQWRNDGRVIDRQTAIEIIDRCLAWSPETLLTILADKPKYGVSLPNMTDARRILHRFVYYRPHPIAQTTEVDAKKKANAEALKNAATFAALLPAHGLKKATDDPVCCALLAQICARNLLFAETLAKKEEGKDAMENTDAGKDDASVPPAKRAPLGAASTRGLLSISSTLASLLSRRSHSTSPDSSHQQRRLPSPEYVSALVEKYKTASHNQADPSDKPEKGSVLAMLEPRKRMSGVTQSALEEQSWIVSAVRDVVRALQTPGVDSSSKKPTLDVLEKVLQKALTKEDAATVTPYDS